MMTPQDPPPAASGGRPRVLFTRDEVAQAVNAGASLVTSGISVSDEAQDMINLVANAALSLLNLPGMTLDQVMDANYDGGSETVRSWWDW